MSDGEVVPGDERGSGDSVRVGYYGDDFTGSVDVLLQFARHGWSGRLFVGIPDAALLRDAAAAHDVVGIAGIARSLPTADIDAEVRPALEALRELRPHLIQYKACSTADSSPSIGSIGRVLEIGRDVVGEAPVPMLFAQPDFGRFTLFGTHFAAEGGVVHRLDRQPTMSTHPSTPMHEADLARHLSRQTALSIGGIPRTAYDRLGDELSRSPHAGLVLDAVDNADAAIVGAAVLAQSAPVFAIGSGGLSWGIGAAAPLDAVALPASTPSHGPVLAVSGSRSAQTRRQIEYAEAAGWLVAPLSFSAADDQIALVRDALDSGRSVALTSDEAPAADDTLERIAEVAAAVIRATTGSTRRVIVAGGDTSGRVTRLLGVTSLAIAANPVGNVVLLRAASDEKGIDGLELLLKGGQVGADSLFDDIRALGA
nr:four-carbon acid sugar kinase family protein [uncultured Microbacterium sp.]